MLLEDSFWAVFKHRHDSHFIMCLDVSDRLVAVINGGDADVQELKDLCG